MRVPSSTQMRACTNSRLRPVTRQLRPRRYLVHGGSKLSSKVLLAACCNVRLACEGSCTEEQGRTSLAVVGAMLRREQVRGIWLDMSVQDQHAGGSGLAPRDLLADIATEWKQKFEALEAFVFENYRLPSIQSYLDVRAPRIETSYLAAAADAAKRQQDGLAPTTLEKLMRFGEYATAASTVVLYYTGERSHCLCPRWQPSQLLWSALRSRS